MELVHDLLRSHPDISSVYIINPANYDICRIIHQFDPKGHISIITNDLIPDQRDLLYSGIISATITQGPEKQGSMPLDVLFRFLAFGERPENFVYHTKLSIHIAANLD